MPDVILRLLFTTWNGVPVASVGVFIIGGLPVGVRSRRYQTIVTIVSVLGSRRRLGRCT